MNKPIKIAALVLLSAAMAGGVSYANRERKVKPVKNVILMIPDGTSTSVLSVVRWFREFNSPEGGKARLASDPYLCGYVRQACSDAPVAASPAAMSSFMTGYHVQSSNLSVYPKKHPGQDLFEVNADSTWQPLATVMEAAKIVGHKSTGLVATVIASHATPAATSSHVVSRADNFNIMRQMASNGVDVVFAGGCRHVDDGVREIFKDKGIKYVEKSVPEFRALDAAPAWALFSDGDMDYDLDRDTTAEPSLVEMTEKAISLLSADRDGFFLMVEGSKVDYAAHSNDPAGIISEYEAFDKAVAAALDFAKKDGNTTVIVVPDHGNSGMTIGDRYYTGYYKKGLDSAFMDLAGYKATANAIASRIQKCAPDEVRGVFRECTGIDLTGEEEKAILNLRNRVEQDYMSVAFSGNVMSVVTSILNSHTHIGYSNGSHTSEDVFLSVYSPSGITPKGLVEGTELAGYMTGIMGIKKSLDELTSEIYVKSDVLLAGHDCTVEDAAEPVLVVDGRLRIPANRSYVEKDGRRTELSSVSVYVPKNRTFYISREILGLL